MIEKCEIQNLRCHITHVRRLLLLIRFAQLV